MYVSDPRMTLLASEKLQFQNQATIAYFVELFRRQESYLRVLYHKSKFANKNERFSIQPISRNFLNH